jgi:D-sedoheptulose 7-phosphate isomerase
MQHGDKLNELEKIIRSFFEKKDNELEQLVHKICERLRAGNKILVFGNGGSAAQAQHFASELVNRFYRERPGLPAVALTTDTSSLTSIANDTSFDYVFSRQIEALGRRGDIAIALSTSGNSTNVIEAMRAARENGMTTIALTGEGGGRIAGLSEFLLDIPSQDTPRIQEAHLFLLHLLAGEVEKRMEEEH